MIIFSGSASDNSQTELLKNIPRLSLGRFPTPVKRISIANGKSCWIKDDGSCALDYGGNKVRKLEYLLAHVKAKGFKRLVVPGDIGSHTVLACCVHGSSAGFDLTAVVYPHLKGLNHAQELSSLKELGVEVLVKRNLLCVIASSRFIAWRDNGFQIPFGASSPHSTLGYVAAAVELSEQIDKGEISPIGTIFVPLGTGGTVAGLLAGFALIDLPVKVVAVQSVEAVFANVSFIKKQVRNVLNLIGRRDLFGKAMERLMRLEGGYLGGGYRVETDSSVSAVKMAAQQGFALEPAFTGKAMAAVIDHVCVDEHDRVLFWNTHDQVGRFR